MLWIRIWYINLLIITLATTIAVKHVVHFEKPHLSGYRPDVHRGLIKCFMFELTACRTM